MSLTETYELPLRSMPEGSMTYERVLTREFFAEMECRDILDGEVAATISVTRKGHDYRVEIRARGHIDIPCDRCLSPMRHDVDATYSVTARYGDVADIDDSLDAVLIVPEAYEKLDVSRLVADTVVLSIPMVHTHPQGECDPEMMEQLRRHSGIAGDAESEDTDPRWDALKSLSNNH